MSYSFAPGRGYRMPTHFGPAWGPRQRPDGGAWDNRSSPRSLVAWATWPLDAALVEPHLPPGFRAPAEPVVLLEWRQRRNLPWLAGRGYNIAMMSVTAELDAGPVAGRLQLVVWESLPDAVITGREELGVPKLWADVSDLDVDFEAGSAVCSAEWDGFEFLRLNLDDLVEDRASDRHDITGPDYLQWRYLPRPGELNTADVSYPTRTPGVTTDPGKILRSWQGTARVQVRAGTFADLPTQGNVVSGVAALVPQQRVSGGLVDKIGNRDLSDQHRLECHE